MRAIRITMLWLRLDHSFCLFIIYCCVTTSRVYVFPSPYSWQRARLMSNMSTSTSAGQGRGQVSMEQLATKRLRGWISSHLGCVWGWGVGVEANWPRPKLVGMFLDAEMSSFPYFIWSSTPISINSMLETGWMKKFQRNVTWETIISKVF